MVCKEEKGIFKSDFPQHQFQFSVYKMANSMEAKALLTLAREDAEVGDHERRDDMI